MTLIDRERRAFDTRAHLEGWGRLSQGKDSRSLRVSRAVLAQVAKYPVANEIAIVTDAEPGAWGPGSGNTPDARNAKAVFALADLARQTVTETWVDARAGEEVYKASQ